MKMNKLSAALLGVSLSAVAGTAFAAAPTLKEVLGASGITATGYVDAAFTYFDTDAGSYSPNYFDNIAKESFRFKQAALTIASQPADGFGALVNVTAGDDANFIHSGNGGSADNIDVTQAYVQYAGSGLTVIGGKFNTLAGAEVIAPTGNTNISRSIAFLNILPFTHTGVRVSYAPMSSLTLYAGQNNGWDLANDTNDSKTIELGASWTSDMVSVAVYGYSGKETVLPDELDRTLIDAVLTVKPIKDLAIVVNYDMFEQEVAGGSDAEAAALNVYLNYQATEQLRGSLRYEIFEDDDGARLGAVDNEVTGLTLTVGYAPKPNFEIRGEVRQDSADQPIFTKDGVADDEQNYFAVEGIYKF